jgi:hypothetical protein
VFVSYQKFLFVVLSHCVHCQFAPEDSVAYDFRIVGRSVQYTNSKVLEKAVCFNKVRYRIKF